MLNKLHYYLFIVLRLKEKSVFTLLFLIIVVSCQLKNKPYHQVVLNKQKSLKLKLSEELFYYKKPNLFEMRDSLYYSAIITHSNTLQIYNVDANKLFLNINYSIIKSHLDSNYSLEEEGVLYDVYTIDSILIIPCRTKKIFILNRKGQIVYHMEIQQDIDFNSKKTIFYSLYSPILVGNNIYINCVPKVSVVTFLERNRYFSYQPVHVFDLQKNHMQSLDIIKWPRDYRDSSNNYRDYHPLLNFDKRTNQFMISFECSPDVYVLKMKQSNNWQFYCYKTKFSDIQQFLSFDDDSIGNMNYTNKYYEQRNYFTKLKYENYLECYYRTYKYFKTEDWKILLYDNEFNCFQEIKIQNSNEYAPYIHHTRKGWYLIRKIKLDTTNTLCIDFFTVKMI